MECHNLCTDHEYVIYIKTLQPTLLSIMHKSNKYFQFQVGTVIVVVYSFQACLTTPRWITIIPTLSNRLLNFLYQKKKGYFFLNLKKIRKIVWLTYVYNRIESPALPRVWKTFFFYFFSPNQKWMFNRRKISYNRPVGFYNLFWFAQFKNIYLPMYWHVYRRIKFVGVAFCWKINDIHICIMYVLYVCIYNRMIRGYSNMRAIILHSSAAPGQTGLEVNGAMNNSKFISNPV